jgi:hypothetical protein
MYSAVSANEIAPDNKKTPLFKSMVRAELGGFRNFFLLIPIACSTHLILHPKGKVVV